MLKLPHNILSAFSAPGTNYVFKTSRTTDTLGFWGNEAGILWEKLKIKCKMKNYEHLKYKWLSDNTRSIAGLLSVTLKALATQYFQEHVKNLLTVQRKWEEFYTPMLISGEMNTNVPT